MAPILDFLTEFRNHDGSLLTNGEPVRRYIEERQDDELAEWDLLFASVGERQGNRTDESLGRTIRCQSRTAGERSDARTLLVSNRQRVSSRGIERTGLNGQERELAERMYGMIRGGAVVRPRAGLSNTRTKHTEKFGRNPF